MREIWPLPWREVRYEDTVADLPVQARATVDSLGLPRGGRVTAVQHRKDKVVLSPTYESVTRPVHGRAVGRWRNYADYLEPVMQALGYK